MTESPFNPHDTKQADEPEPVEERDPEAGDPPPDESPQDPGGDPQEPDLDEDPEK